MKMGLRLNYHIYHCALMIILVGIRAQTKMGLRLLHQISADIGIDAAMLELEPR